MIDVLATAALAGAFAFPGSPIDSEVRSGMDSFRRGRGIERVYGRDRAVLGRWFDGRVKRDAEFAVWISPGLVSRWLGYLGAKEKWPSGELQRRWSELKRHLDGRLVFVVLLAAYPKIDPFEEPEPTGGSDASEIDGPRFLITSGGAVIEPPRPDELFGIRYTVAGRATLSDSSAAGLRLEPDVAQLALLRGRSLGDLGGYRWHHDCPFGAELRSEHEFPWSMRPLPIGPFHQGWYLASAPAPPGWESVEAFELRVFTSRGERVGHFRAAGAARTAPKAGA